MSKEFDARLSHLDMCLEHAVVEQLTDNADGPQTFSVFVPGVVREHNEVVAADEAEAKQKVRDVLVSKLQHYETKGAPTGTDTKLDVQNGKISPHGQHVESEGSNV